MFAFGDTFRNTALRDVFLSEDGGIYPREIQGRVNGK
jgi:hypothetical protein